MTKIDPARRTAVNQARAILYHSSIDDAQRRQKLIALRDAPETPAEEKRNIDILIATLDLTAKTA